MLLELAGAAFGPYGWFIDELYYRACAARLAFGYVDHPPLSIGVLAASHALLGDALLPMRVWPALAVAGAALVSALLARRLGGGAFAEVLATLSVLGSPVALVLGSFFSMNAFELLLWPASALLLIEVLSRGGALWLGLGALLGVCVLNKHTSVPFALALVVGSLFTPARRHFLTPWPWLGALVAAALVAPNVAWQAAHGWPSLEFYEQAQRLKNIPTPAFSVLANQVLVTGPVAAPLALLGVVALLRDRVRAASVAFAVAYILLLGALMLSHSSRPERIVAIYPVVFAAGAAALERIARGRCRWLAPASLVLSVAGALAFMPLTLPLLPVPRVAAYAAALGVVPQLERGRQSSLPQWLADRLAWPELVAHIARVYAGLSPKERAHALLFAPSYGEAGALELWGPGLGLPAVLSNHNSYFFWSQSYLDENEPQAAPEPEVVIAIGLSREALERWFARVEAAEPFRCGDCIDWRRQRAVWVARSPRQPLARIWRELKHFE